MGVVTEAPAPSISTSGAASGLVRGLMLSFGEGRPHEVHSDRSLNTGLLERHRREVRGETKVTPARPSHTGPRRRVHDASAPPG